MSCENIIEAQKGNKEGDTPSASKMLPPNLCSKKFHWVHRNDEINDSGDSKSAPIYDIEK